MSKKSKVISTWFEPLILGILSVGYPFELQDNYQCTVKLIFIRTFEVLLLLFTCVRVGTSDSCNAHLKPCRLSQDEFVGNAEKYL